MQDQHHQQPSRLHGVEIGSTRGRDLMISENQSSGSSSAENGSHAEDSQISGEGSYFSSESSSSYTSSIDNNRYNATAGAGPSGFYKPSPDYNGVRSRGNHNDIGMHN